jgi:hypothetical protein
MYPESWVTEKFVDHKLSVRALKEILNTRFFVHHLLIHDQVVTQIEIKIIKKSLNYHVKLEPWAFRD